MPPNSLRTNTFTNKLYPLQALTLKQTRTSKSGPEAQLFLFSKLNVTLLWWVGQLFFC